VKPHEIEPGQLVPVEEVGRLESQFPDLSMDEAYDAHDLRFSPEADDRARFLGYRDARHYQEALTEHIHRSGIQNPIGICPPYDGRRFEAGVGNGQHRYFAARDLGLPHIPAQQQAVRPLPLVPGWDYAAGPDADAGLEAG
jgi:hypothetical protein